MFMVNRAGLLSNDVPSLLRKLLEIHQEETLHAQQATWASHIEGRHTGLNGRHPLQAEALQHGTVPSGSEFLHVGDAAVAGWKQWHVAAAAAHRNLGRSARELGSHGNHQVAKVAGKRGCKFAVRVFMYLSSHVCDKDLHVPLASPVCTHRVVLS